MKRTALIAAQILFVPVEAVSALELYQFLVGVAPSLDFRAFPYGSVAVNVIFETLAAAVVAALVAFPTRWLYGRFGPLAALTVVVPIFRSASPWNSVFHDFQWPRLYWELAFYECIIIVLLILWFGALASRRAGPAKEGVDD